MFHLPPRDTNCIKAVIESIVLRHHDSDWKSIFSQASQRKKYEMEFARAISLEEGVPKMSNKRSRNTSGIKKKVKIIFADNFVSNVSRHDELNICFILL